MTAASFVVFAGIAALMLAEKFPVHLGAVKASVPGRSAVVQSVGYSAPIGSPASLEAGPSVPSTSTDTYFPKALPHRSDQSSNQSSGRSQDVIVRRFSTDLGITSKNSDNKQQLRRIFFKEDSDVIDSQYRPWLRQLADALAKDPRALVTLEGHTDGSGQEAHNLRLSSRRAMAVRNVLVNELHVPEARLIASGVGSRAPLQPDSTAEGRAYNRRVEVRPTRSSD